MNKNQTVEWVHHEMQDKIIVDEDILNYEKRLSGIYGIFITDKNNQEICAYVGRSANIYRRFFSGVNAHLVKIRNGECSNNAINKALQNEEDKIVIKVLDSDVYQYDDYVLDMQRMASRECYYIDYYQQKNQCLEQLPDGSNMDKSKWEIASRKRNM